MEFLLAFFTCFAFQISNVFIANILFVVCFAFESIRCKKVQMRKNAYWFLLFMACVVISTTVYALTIGEFEMRQAFQFLYNMMYAFLVIIVKMDYSKFRRYFVGSAKLLSALMCVLFVVLAMSKGANIILDKLWAKNYVPGWPNGTALVLVFSFYLLFKFDYKLQDKILVGVAMILTTSRLALLGLLVITFYFELFTRSQRRKYIKKITFVTVFCVICFVVVWYIFANRNEEVDFVYMLTRAWDRLEIAGVSLKYISRRPLLGYGGNTLDVIERYAGVLIETTVNWGHSHSTLLELLIRYGIMGALAFFGLAFSGLKYIKSRTDRFVCVFLWGCSLIQIYFRSFPFLMMMIFLLNNDESKGNVLEKNDGPSKGD